MNATSNYSVAKTGKATDAGLGDVRRHIERLLLRLDFNGGFSNARKRDKMEANILAQGGLA